MRKCTSLSNQTLGIEKAASLFSGKAVFSCSTVSPPMPDKPRFPAISSQTANNAAKKNLLPKTHYFCGGLANGPVVLVVQIEGQKNALKKRGEARA